MCRRRKARTWRAGEPPLADTPTPAHKRWLSDITTPVRKRWLSDEQGSEIVSHVLVQTLVVFVVLGLLQLAFALHVRNISIDAASEGARRAALVGATLGEGKVRTETLLSGSLGANVPRQVELFEQNRDGDRIVVARVETRLPVFGPFGPSHALKVTASAWKEPQ